MDSSNHSSVLSGYLKPDYAFSTPCYAFNLILSLPTNGYALWLILTGAGGTMASEFFALHLAVSEMLYCLCAVFVFVYIHFPLPPLLALVAFFGGFLFPGRPLFQCCICFERYLAVVHPVVFLKYRPLRYKVGCSGLVWLVVIGFCFTFMLFKDQLVLYYGSLGECLVFIAFLLFCCLSVLRALKQPGPGEGERESEGTNSMKRRAFKIIVIIMVSMMVNYLLWVVVIPFIGILDSGQFVHATYVCLFISVVSGFGSPCSTSTGLGNCPLSEVSEGESIPPVSPDTEGQL